MFSFIKKLFTSTAHIPTGMNNPTIDLPPPEGASLEPLVNTMADKIHPFEFSLGDEVTDIVTGFKGVVTYRCQWLNACNTYGVKPRKLKDGATLSSETFDEPQLQLVEPKVVEATQSTGGPEREVSRPS